jgi:hypothetical protein
MPASLLSMGSTSLLPSNMHKLFSVMILTIKLLSTTKHNANGQQPLMNVEAEIGIDLHNRLKGV